MARKLGLFLILGIVFLSYAKLPQIDSKITCISQTDIGVHGFVIDTPGTYLITENVNLNPPVNKAQLASTAITIACDNVILDLNCYAVQQESDIFSGIGIKIASPGNMVLNNITIKNGVVGNFTSVGIYAHGVHNLLLQDLVVSNNGMSGPFTDGELLPFVGGIAITGLNKTSSSAITISNIRAIHNGGCPDAPTYGAMFNNVVGVSIKDSQFNNNISPSNGVAGLYAINSNTIQIKESEASNNYGANFAVGFFVDNSLYSNGIVIIDHCVAQQNILEGMPNPSEEQTMLFADGFYLRGLAKHSNISNCSANGQVSRLCPPTSLATSINGFELEASFDIILDTCIALDNGGFTVTNNFARGFHIGGDRITLKNCYTEGNLGQRSTYTYDIANFNNFGSASQGIPCQISFLNCTSQTGLKTAKRQKTQ